FLLSKAGFQNRRFTRWGDPRCRKDVHSDLRYTPPSHVQLFGGAIRKVNNSARSYRSAVIDADDHELVVLQIGDLYPGPQRKLHMCRSVSVHIVRLTAGRFLALEQLSIPAGISHLVRL